MKYHFARHYFSFCVHVNLLELIHFCQIQKNICQLHWSIKLHLISCKKPQRNGEAHHSPLSVLSLNRSKPCTGLQLGEDVRSEKGRHIAFIGSVRLCRPPLIGVQKNDGSHQLTSSSIYEMDAPNSA